MEGENTATEEDVWAEIPKIRSENCPQGLECLTRVDHVIIGFGKGNRHSVNNTRGQKIFYVVDGSNFCVRNVCCNCVSFKLEFLDHRGNEIIQMRRSCACCCPCCPAGTPPQMNVFAPPGTYIGGVKQNWACFRKSFTVKDALRQTAMRIIGPVCFNCCAAPPLEYKILKDRIPVGRISKSWTDLDRILFGRNSLVGVSFPLDLDVRLKAVLIGACFLAYKKCG